jgi:hypothetical protein
MGFNSGLKGLMEWSEDSKTLFECLFNNSYIHRGDTRVYDYGPLVE